MAFGTLEHSFWEDPDLQEMGLEGRSVAAYLLTCRHSTTEGYYRLSVGYICDDLRIERATAIAHLRALDLQNFARWDEASQVVFIRNSMRYHPPTGPKSVAGALKKALQVPMNPFRGLFYDAAHQWAPEFAAALAAAGWVSTGPEPEQSLFDHHPTPAPPEQPGEAKQVDVVEEILRQAATISVQQSIANREPIRNPQAVAQSRLASHREQWAPKVREWLGYFDAATIDMARALADGGTASPYWRRSSGTAVTPE